MTHQTKSRPVRGLLLLALSVFLTFPASCGAVGTFLDRATLYLFGNTGAALLLTIAYVSGLLLIIPPHAWVRFVCWAFPPTTKRAERVERHERVESPVAKVIPIRPPPLPAVKDARGGLKYLGYGIGEIDSAMERIDQHGTADEMIRSALKLLRKAA